MKTYGQYCAAAKALDIVGDRWTLLIVRELLLRGACRYTDLRDGLPGIATNLLAERLRSLEEAGVVAREEAAPPVATALFRLTERGEELEPVIQALVRWGGPLMQESLPTDEFRSHWLALPVSAFVADRLPEGPPIAIQVRVDGEPVVIEAAEGTIGTRSGIVPNPDATLSGPPSLVLAVITGSLGVAVARRRGLRCTGDQAALRRLGMQ